MKKKIREFLPQTAIYLLGYSIALKLPSETMGAQYGEVSQLINGWLDTETEAGLDGVKPVNHGNMQYDCPMCDEHLDTVLCDGSKLNFCPNCGTKIDWGEKDEFPAVL